MSEDSNQQDRSGASSDGVSVQVSITGRRATLVRSISISFDEDRKPGATSDLSRPAMADDQALDGADKTDWRSASAPGIGDYALPAVAPIGYATMTSCAPEFVAVHNNTNTRKIRRILLKNRLHLGSLDGKNIYVFSEMTKQLASLIESGDLIRVAIESINALEKPILVGKQK
jgi:hypothetical protein